MSSTCYTLPSELQERATAAAEQLGVSTHEFILDAIRKAAESVEQRAEFVAEALTAREEMLRSGQGAEPDDVRAYFRNRSINKDTPKPEPKPWRKYSGETRDFPKKTPPVKEARNGDYRQNSRRGQRART